MSVICLEKREDGGSCGLQLTQARAGGSDVAGWRPQCVQGGQ